VCYEGLLHIPFRVCCQLSVACCIFSVRSDGLLAFPVLLVAGREGLLFSFSWCKVAWFVNGGVES
jgi:hypothetical protein